MTYSEIHGLLKSLKEIDKEVEEKAIIVEALYDDMAAAKIDERIESIDDACQRILTTWEEKSGEKLHNFETAPSLLDFVQELVSMAEGMGFPFEDDDLNEAFDIATKHAVERYGE